MGYIVRPCRKKEAWKEGSMEGRRDRTETPREGERKRGRKEGSPPQPHPAKLQLCTAAEG
jgi:hypothetical protein